MDNNSKQVKNVVIMKLVVLILGILFVYLPLPISADSFLEIRATVTGVLNFETGYGYFISAGPHPDLGHTVWLWIGENKVVTRKLDNLKGYMVDATGKLEQTDPHWRGSIPPLAMYMSDFSIEHSTKPND